jgi:hypothetical protein
MSLYDKYFSSRNKNYMFRIVSDIVQQETGKSIINNSEMILFYKNKYSIIFDKSESDNLSDLNKELIDGIGSEIISLIKREYINNDIKITHSPKKQEIINDLNLSIVIDSSRKTNDSLNRFNYNYQFKGSVNKISLEGIEVPKEDNILFSNPNIIIKIDDNYQFYCGMVTKQILNREFLIYKPKKNIIIPIKNNKINIKILNYLEQENDNKRKDKIKIKNIKKINFKNIDYLGFQLESIEYSDFMIDDIIGVFNDNDECIYTSLIKKIQDIFIFTTDLNLEENNNYYCQNMSLQHKIELNYE